MWPVDLMDQTSQQIERLRPQLARLRQLFVRSTRHWLIPRSAQNACLQTFCLHTPVTSRTPGNTQIGEPTKCKL